MRRRLYAVLRSYSSRPWTVAGALLYVVVASVASIGTVATWFSSGPRELESIFDRRYERLAILNQPSELVTWSTDTSKFNFYKGISIGRRRYQEAIGETTSSSDSKIAIQPNNNFQELNSQSIQCLAQLSFLRHLELNEINLTPELWQAISSLKALRYLRIHSKGKVDIKELPILPKLELLSLGSVDPCELAVLRKQPNLRSLELSDSDFNELVANNDATAKHASLHEFIELRELIVKPRRPEPNAIEEIALSNGKHESMKTLPISPQLCNEISQLPNLRLVSVGERGSKLSSQFYDDGLTKAAAVSAKSIALNSRSTGSGLGLTLVDIMLSLFLLAILWTQLQYQLSNSASLLLPNFIGPHLLLPILCILGHVTLFSMLRTLVNGSHLIPSLVESFSVLSMLCVFPTNSKARYVTAVLPFAPFFLASYIPPLLEDPSYRLFLIGEYPVWALAILFVELIVMAIALVQIAKQPKTLAIANHIDDAVGIHWSEQPKESNTENKRLQRFLVRLPTGSQKAHVQLWNAGFEQSRIGKLDLQMSSVLLPSVLFIAYAVSNGFQDANAVYGLTAFIPLGLLIVGIYALLLKSFVYVNGMLVRQPLFEQESILPISKSLMRRIRIGGLWVEVWPLLFVSLVCACAAIVTKALAPGWLQMPIDLIWLLYMHCMLSVVGVWGLGLLLLTIQLTGDRRWIAYPLVIGWALSLLCILYEWQNPHFQLFSNLEIFAIMWPGAVGVLLVSIAWIRFPNVEWGNASDH